MHCSHEGSLDFFSSLSWKGRKQFSLQVNPGSPLGLTATVVQSPLLNQSWGKKEKGGKSFFLPWSFCVFASSSYLLQAAPVHRYGSLDEQLSGALWWSILCRSQVLLGGLTEQSFHLPQQHKILKDSQTSEPNWEKLVFLEGGDAFLVCYFVFCGGIWGNQDSCEDGDGDKCIPARSLPSKIQLP